MKRQRTLRRTLAALLGSEKSATTPSVVPGARRWLLASYQHYRRLPHDLRDRFDADVALFLGQKRITGVSFDPDEVDRLQVASSAVTLSLAWPDYNWDQLSEVLLYADDFDRDFRFDDPEFAGQAHPWGTVLLSAPSLDDSFADPEDGFHVGLHEFAHLLNLGGGGISSLPAGVSAREALRWQGLAETEMARLREGDSVLDPYGSDDLVEFFPVAIEAFFERPRELRRLHGDLYGFLSTYLGQDPAAWDDILGVGGAPMANRRPRRRRR